MDMKQLADSILEAVKAYVGKNVLELSERMDSFAKRLDEMPVPENGKDGRDGVDGKDGAPGESIKGDPGSDGKDGRDGVDGEHGRDALDIDILKSINEEKRYARGTYATHKGGLWVSRRTTDGMDGWECIVRGWDLPEVTQDEEDPRVIKMVMRSSDGEEVTKSLYIPFVVDKGVFKDGNTYKSGDGVTWGGCFWIAKQDTTEKPQGGDSWRLAVKKGRDASTSSVRIGGVQ